MAARRRRFHAARRHGRRQPRAGAPPRRPRRRAARRGAPRLGRPRAICRASTSITCGGRSAGICSAARCWRARAGGSGGRLRARGARAVANGGNCALADANWVHYLHAAFVRRPRGRRPRRAKQALTHRRTSPPSAVRCGRPRGDLQQRAHPAAGRRIARARRHAGPRRLLRDRRGSVCAGERGRASVGAPTPGLAARSAARRLRGRAGRSAQGVRHAVRGVGCRSAATSAGTPISSSSAPAPSCQRGASAPPPPGWPTESVSSDSAADVPEILAALDGLVHPARYEAYGLSVHEALCRGVPSIVSASAGIAERYPGGLHPTAHRPNPDDPARARRAASILALATSSSCAKPSCRCQRRSGRGPGTRWRRQS